MRVPRDGLLSGGVDFLPNARVRRAAHAVIGGVRLALVLGQRQQGSVPAIRAHTSGVGQRDSEVIADIWSGDAFGLIFVESGVPLTGQIDLGRRGEGREPR